MEGIGAFQRVVDDPDGYLKFLKAGKNILGYCCSYTPEEIIHAAGIHPVRLFGSREESNLSDKHLQSYCCSLVRDVLRCALGKALFPGRRRLSPYLRHDPAALGYLASQCPSGFSPISCCRSSSTPKAPGSTSWTSLRKFRKSWEKASVTVTDDASGRRSPYNAIRGAQISMRSMRTTPELIPGSALNACTASMILDRNEAAAMLEEVVDRS